MRPLLIAVQAFLAVNAMAGGLMLMLAPDGNLLQLPPSFMRTRLFPDYFWPGLILFAVLGLGHAIGCMLTVRRAAIAGRAAIGLGIGTLIWIAVQVLLTDLFWLQALIAALGALELLAARRVR
ncbi:MAG: hypothetical protein H6591_08815 [Flavobacteriales bacterium]|nr:hypothetical protein [Flavobacteriales bacterium]